MRSLVLYIDTKPYRNITFDSITSQFVPVISIPVRIYFGYYRGTILGDQKFTVKYYGENYSVNTVLY